MYTYFAVYSFFDLLSYSCIEDVLSAWTVLAELHLDF